MLDFNQKLIIQDKIFQIIKNILFGGKWQNDCKSAPEPQMKKINPLYNLQLLKLKKSFFIFFTFEAQEPIYSHFVVFQIEVAVPFSLNIWKYDFLGDKTFCNQFLNTLPLAYFNYKMLSAFKLVQMCCWSWTKK